LRSRTPSIRFEAEVSASDKQHFLARTPADTGMAFFPVQHLAPSHPLALAEIE
jgi:hypothetical protein